MAINVVSVQHSDGFLLDMILLLLCYDHRGTRLNVMKRFLSWQPMIPPKRFDIFPRCLGDAQKVYMRSDFSLNHVCYDFPHPPELRDRKRHNRSLLRALGYETLRRVVPSPGPALILYPI